MNVYFKCLGVSTQAITQSTKLSSDTPNITIYWTGNKQRTNILARDANIGDATNNPTINAEDNMPSSKLLRLKSPLEAKYMVNQQGA
jgi:hypothetical protein